MLQTGQTLLVRLSMQNLCLAFDVIQLTLYLKIYLEKHEYSFATCIELFEDDFEYLKI